MTHTGSRFVFRAGLLFAAVVLVLWAPADAWAKENPKPVTVESGEIRVINDETEPIPVVILSDDSPEMIHFNLDINILSGDQWGNANFDIPDGYRLMIDYVTVRAAFLPGQRGALQIVTWADNLDSTGVQHHFALTPLGVGISTTPGYESHFLSEATTIFGDPAPGAYPEVSVSIVRGSDLSGLGGGRVSITGRLVELE